MTFFASFPYTTTDIVNGESTLVVDFIRSASLSVDNTDAIFEDYEVADNERIEDIAYRLYGDPNYHYVLLFINDIKNPFDELPKSDYILRQACVDAFGSIDGIHHYENPLKSGDIVDYTYQNAIPITNMDYMTSENEKNRIIRILKSQYLTDFVSSYLSELTT